MAQAIINTGVSSTWVVPAGLNAGTFIVVEGWGGGGGGGSRSSGSAFGSGGGGGGYILSSYMLTPNDVANGIAYVVGATVAGGAGGDGVNGNNTTFSTNVVNLLPNSIMNGCVPPSTQPTGWSIDTPSPTLTMSNLGPGFAAGMSSLDCNWTGTTGGTNFACSFSSFITASPSSAYTASGYFALVGGSTTNITSIVLSVTNWTGAHVFISTMASTTVTLTGNLVRWTVSGTSASNTGALTVGLVCNCSTSVAVNITIRVAGVQLEKAAAATFYKSTPGYLLVGGGSRSNGASGGAGGTGSVGTGTAHAGGAGAAFNAAGSGGGGAGGKDAIGGVGTTAGVGGQGDPAVGGAGGAVSTTSPGNPGTANVEGGGGGGGLTTVGGTGTAAGAGAVPGGGGGGQVFWNSVSNSSGGTGANGQLRITYTQDMSGIFEPNNIQLWSP